MIISVTNDNVLPSYYGIEEQTYTNAVICAARRQLAMEQQLCGVRPI